MSKSVPTSAPKRAKSLVISLQPRSPERAQEIQRLKTELEPIARLTTSGDMTALTILLWNSAIAKCRGRLDKFAGIDEATESVADAFEQAVHAKFNR